MKTDRSRVHTLVCDAGSDCDNYGDVLFCKRRGATHYEFGIHSHKKMAGTSPAIATRGNSFRRYAAPLKFCPRIGRVRSRLPVAAKIALVTAGWIMVAAGSPTPPHFLPGVGVR